MSRRNSFDRGLFQRPSGSGIWWIRYHDAVGREHREKVGQKELARAAYAKRKTDIREEKFFPEAVRRRRMMTLAQLIDNYLPEANANHRCYQNDISLAKTWKDAFGELALSQVTPNNLEQWKIERLKVRKPATVARQLAWLKTLFQFAIRLDIVRKNPVMKVKMPRVNNMRVRFLTDTEEGGLSSVMAPEDYEIVELAFHTGMRRGEIFPMKWIYVDFANGLITVPTSKSGKRRYVVLNRRAMGILQARRRRYPLSEFVLPKITLTGPMDAANFCQRVFRPALAAAGIMDFRFHDLRHTFGSRLAMAGVPMRTIQELMGHHSVVVTERYAHLAAGHLHEAVMRLERVPEP